MTKFAGAIAAAIALVLVVASFAVITGGNPPPAPVCGPGPAAAAANPAGTAPGKRGFQAAPSQPYREGGDHSFTVTEPMLRNVAAVAGVANQIWPQDQVRRERATLIATITMMVESQLLNKASRAVPATLNVPNDGVTAGDHDSAGLFQQRVDAGYYGTAGQIMDPAYGAAMFFGHPPPGAPATHSWGLDDYQRVKGSDWLAEDPGVVAAKIQRPAKQYEYRYGLWVDSAGKVIEAAAGIHVDTSTGVDGACLPGSESAADCPSAGLPQVEKGLTPDALLVLKCGKEKFPQIRDLGGVGDRPAGVDDDHQTGRGLDFMTYDDLALGQQIADWAKGQASQMGVKYIIFNERIWSTARAGEGWRPCSAGSCYSGPDDTLAHRDHVHISVEGNAAKPQPAIAGQSGPVVLPVAPGKYKLGSTFGAVGSWARYHTGADIQAPMGEPILAVAAGKVVAPTGGSWAGTHVVLRHADGSHTLYAHMSAKTVNEGDDVTPGQEIGKLGQTGRAFGPHLHFEHYPAGVQPGDVYQADDPIKWLKSQGAKV